MKRREQRDRRTRAAFETVPRRIEDIVDRVAEIERYPLLVASDAAGKVLGWVGLSSYSDCYAGIGEFSVYLERAARSPGVGR